VLSRAPAAPLDLKERSLQLAGALLELGGDAIGTGIARAREVLDSGLAEARFNAICIAQGGLRTPPLALHRAPVLAPYSGTVNTIDNRLVSRIAKLAGAPLAPAAGLELHVHVGQSVARGEAMFTVHAESPGELAYALAYHARHAHAISLRHA